MENNFNRVDRVAKLLSTLDNPKTTRDARIDIYLVLVREISKDTSDIIEDLSRSAVLLQKHIKADMKLDDSALVQSALNVLGYLLHLPDIVSSFSTSILKSIVQDLCLLLETSNDKSVCTRALWCLSRQTVPDDIISKELSRLLTMLNGCIVGKSFESSAVEFEAINVFQRLLKQCPARLLTNDDDWFKMVYPFVISKNVKVAERALKFLEKNIHLLRDRSENFSKSLINDLYEGLTDRLKVMFGKERKVFVLRVWSCYTTILGKNMHQGTRLTNNLFKVVEQAFKSNSSEVLVAAFEAWMVLIDNFATSKAAILSKKRLKLLLMPLTNSTSRSERSLLVEQARLKCWLHLISVIKDNINEVFDQVVAPLLYYIFAMPNFDTKNVDLSLNKTPTKTDEHDEAKVQTPRTPRTPRTPAANVFDQAVQSSPKGKALHFDSDILKKIGAQIIYLLMKTSETEDDSLDIKIHFVPERLSLENFKNNNIIFMLALQDLTLKCGKELDEKLLYAVWNCVLHYASKMAMPAHEKKCLTVTIGGLLLSLQVLVDNDCTSQQIALRITSLCYENLKDIISENKDLVKTEKNPQGSFPMHIIHLLFHESRFIGNVLTKKFYSFYDTLIQDIVSGVSGQFYAFMQMIETIKTLSGNFVDQDATRRLWITTAGHLTNYINQTHEVNQGTSLDHDFSVTLEMLLFPITKIFDSELPTAVMKDINICWSNLFSSLVRESSLLPTIEDNQAVEDFCMKIDHFAANGDINLSDFSFLGKMLRILSMVTENLKYNVGSMENQSNRVKKTGNPLKNAKSLVAVIQRILKELMCEDATTEKLADQHLGELFEIIGTYFSKITGPDLVVGSIARLGQDVASFIIEEKPKGVSWAASKRGSSKKANASKYLQMVWKVFDEIYTCIFERFGKTLDNELLIALVPVLKASFLCERAAIRSHAVEFWNKSFGQMNHLIYPNDLRSVLQHVKSNVAVIVPGLQGEKDGKLVIPESEDSSPQSIVRSPNIRKTMTPSLRSPHKIHGSFLQKALSAEKAGRSPSPGKIQIPKSPVSESRIKPVRRKLPLPLDHDDPNEFVTIAPSPKKRRILTEHQKEVLRSKSNVPVLYNELDQTTQEPVFTEETQYTMDAIDFHASKADSQDSVDSFTKVNGAKNGRSKSDNAEISDMANDNRKDATADCDEANNDEANSDKTSNCKSENEITKNAKGRGKALENDKGENENKRRTAKEQNVAKTDNKSRVTKQQDKTKTRRSLRTTFKDVFKLVQDKSAYENAELPRADDAKLGESIEEIEDDIIPSSYTPLSQSETDCPLSFKFSSSSLYSRTASSSASTLNRLESLPSKAEDEKRDADVKDIVAEKADVSSDESTNLSNQVPTSPDLIPSSQSQEDATPVLKGISMITPRRSNRTIKKTEKALEAEKVYKSRKASESSPHKSIESGSTEQVGEYLVNKKKKESENSHVQAKDPASQEKVPEDSNLTDGFGKMLGKKTKIQNISGDCSQDVEFVSRKESSDNIISISDDEIDNALCEMDLIVEAPRGDVVHEWLEGSDENKVDERVREKGGQKKRKLEDTNLDKIDDQALTITTDERIDLIDASQSESIEQDIEINDGHEQAEIEKGAENETKDKNENEKKNKDKIQREEARVTEKKTGKRKAKRKFTDSSDEITAPKRRSTRIVKRDEQVDASVSMKENTSKKPNESVIYVTDANVIEKIDNIVPDKPAEELSSSENLSNGLSSDAMMDSNDTLIATVDSEESSSVKASSPSSQATCKQGAPKGMLEEQSGNEDDKEMKIRRHETVVLLEDGMDYGEVKKIEEDKEEKLVSPSKIVKDAPEKVHDDVNLETQKQKTTIDQSSSEAHGNRKNNVSKEIQVTDLTEKDTEIIFLDDKAENSKRTRDFERNDITIVDDEVQEVAKKGVVTDSKATKQLSICNTSNEKALKSVKNSISVVEGEKYEGKPKSTRRSLRQSKLKGVRTRASVSRKGAESSRVVVVADGEEKGTVEKKVAPESETKKQISYICEVGNEEQISQSEEDVNSAVEGKECADKLQLKQVAAKKSSSRNKGDTTDDATENVSGRINPVDPEHDKETELANEEVVSKPVTAAQLPTNCDASNNEHLDLKRESSSVLEDQKQEKIPEGDDRNHSELRETTMIASVSTKALDASTVKSLDGKVDCSNVEDDVSAKKGSKHEEIGIKVDFDSSFEDSLTLSEIRKKSNETNSEEIAADLEGAIENKVGKDNENDLIGRGTAGGAEGKFVNQRKSKRARFENCLDTETIENIFNSPDSPVVDRRRTVSNGKSFEILERETVGESKVNDELSDSTQNDVDSNEVNAMGKNQQLKLSDDKSKSQNPEILMSSSDHNTIVSNKAPQTTRMTTRSNNPIASVAVGRVTSVPLGIKKAAECSPISGILRRRTGGAPQTPSPPNKNRRVSFAFPLEEQRSISNFKEPDRCNVLAVPLPANDENEPLSVSTRGTSNRFTAIKKRLSSPKILSCNKGPPICPDLLHCTTPIESLLPSITSGSSSFGLGNFIRSLNIRTVGDLCALSELQIEALPIRAPKVQVVKAALMRYKSMQKKGDKSRPSPILSSNDLSSSGKKLAKDDPKLPIPDSTNIGTPTRKSRKKPTSLIFQLAESPIEKKSTLRFATRNKSGSEVQCEVPVAAKRGIAGEETDVLGKKSNKNSEGEGEVCQEKKESAENACIIGVFDVAAKEQSKDQSLDEDNKSNNEIRISKSKECIVIAEASETALTADVAEISGIEIIDETDEIEDMKDRNVDAIPLEGIINRKEKIEGLDAADDVLADDVDEMPLDEAKKKKDSQQDSVEISRIVVEDNEEETENLLEMKEIVTGHNENGSEEQRKSHKIRTGSAGCKEDKGRLQTDKVVSIDLESISGIVLKPPQTDSVRVNGGEDADLSYTNEGSDDCIEVAINSTLKPFETKSDNSENKLGPFATKPGLYETISESSATNNESSETYSKQFGKDIDLIEANVENGSNFEYAKGFVAEPSKTALEQDNSMEDGELPQVNKGSGDNMQGLENVAPQPDVTTLKGSAKLDRTEIDMADNAESGVAEVIEDMEDMKDLEDKEIHVQDEDQQKDGKISAYDEEVIMVVEEADCDVKKQARTIKDLSDVKNEEVVMECCEGLQKHVSCGSVALEADETKRSDFTVAADASLGPARENVCTDVPESEYIFDSLVVDNVSVKIVSNDTHCIKSCPVPSVGDVAYGPSLSDKPKDVHIPEIDRPDSAKSKIVEIINVESNLQDEASSEEPTSMQIIEERQELFKTIVTRTAEICVDTDKVQNNEDLNEQVEGTVSDETRAGCSVQVNAVSIEKTESTSETWSSQLNKVIEGLKQSVSGLSLQESIAIYRKLRDGQNFVFNEIEERIKNGL